jgi:hypothetical protein
MAGPDKAPPASHALTAMQFGALAATCCRVPMAAALTFFRISVYVVVVTQFPNETPTPPSTPAKFGTLTTFVAT